MTKATNEIKIQVATEDYLKKHYLEYREFIKVNGKIKAFITKTDNGYTYAFGKPSQKSYLSFSGKEPLTLEQARNHAIESIQKCTEAFSNAASTGIVVL